MKRGTATKQITEGVIWKQILAFFFPILLGTFFQQMYNTVDTIIAHLGEVGTVRYEYGYAAAISVFLFALMALTRLIIDRALNAAGR